MEKNIKKNVSMYMGFPCGSVGKEAACHVGDDRDMGSITELGRSPGEWHGNQLQYFCLENPMDRRAWQVTVHRLQRGGHD